MASPKRRLKVMAAGLPEQETLLLAAWLGPEGMDLALLQGGVPQCVQQGADVLLVDGSLLLSDPQWLDAAGRADFLPALVAVVARGGVAETVKALNNGATDCLVRPLRADKAALAMRKAAGLKDLQGQVDRLRGEVDGESALARIVGESSAMRQALAMAVHAADQPVDVLIRGETGTGKELFARALHGLSGRRQQPFVAVDCGALPADLFESLLFGHRKGAFTGASEDRMGFLEQAQGGTLFLDEVGNLPLAAQAKLLRALQTRENWRLGDLQPSALDIRVMAATNSDLEAEVRQGSFRLDFFHRLQDFPLSLPPLRERDGDVLLLAQLFLNRHCARFNLAPLRLDPELCAHLQAYPWPGNVRQLENAMKHAAVMASETVHLADMPEDLKRWVPTAAEASRPAAPSFEPELPQGLLPLWQAEKLVVDQVEKHLIAQALQRAGQDRAKAALELDLHPKTLQKKIKEHGLG